MLTVPRFVFAVAAIAASLAVAAPASAETTLTEAAVAAAERIHTDTSAGLRQVGLPHCIGFT